MSKTPAPRRRVWRHARWVALTALVVILGGVLVLPRLLETEAARRQILKQANALLAPRGGLRVDRFAFSWLGPTRMSGFAILNASGEPVVEAPLAIWDRSLIQILFDRPRYGTLELGEASVAIERRADGSIDLQEALGPILVPDPRTELTIRIRDGRLHLRSPEFREPLLAERLDATIRRPAAPGPLTWDIDLARDRTATSPRLSIAGDTNPWARAGMGSVPDDVTALVDADRWPVDVVVDATAVRGVWSGSLRAARRGGYWQSRGDATLAGLEYRRSAAGGVDSPMELDRVEGRWEIAQTRAGWVVPSLEVSTPFGELRGAADLAATVSPEAAPRIEGRLEGDIDLAALASLAPGAFTENQRLESGHARLDLTTTAENVLIAAHEPILMMLIGYQEDSPPAPPLPPGAEVHVAGRIDLEDLLWIGSEGPLEIPPLTVAVEAAYRSDDGAVAIEAIEMTGPLGRLTASGRIDDPTGHPTASLDGTLTPDWESIRRRLAEAVDTEIYVDGNPVHFRLAGPLGGGDLRALWEGFTAEARLDLNTVDAFGLHAGPTTVAARSVEGELAIDPIVATVNGGRVELFPELEIADDGPTILRLSPLSRAEGVAVNDDVSQHVLAYVAPIMSQATRARGRVSATVTKAEFPMDVVGAEGSPAAPGSIVEGLVVFEDVEFVAGPLAEDILDLLKVRGDRTIRLDQPVLLAIAGSKVHQHGLAIPIAGVTSIEMEGTVGFNKSIDLRTSVPLTAQMFGDADVLGAIADGVRITVPITGTLNRPKLDKQAFARGMADAGRDLLGRSAVVGGVELLRKILTPPDPEAAARRQKERERKAEERRRRQEENRRGREGL